MTLTDGISIFRRDHAEPVAEASPGECCYDPRTDVSRVRGPSPIPASSHHRVDGELVAILDGARRPSETVNEQFRRKEHELGSVFANLSIIESLAMHKRLVTPRLGDDLAIKFSRLVVERRNRLLAFLADAPRRAARR